MTHHQPTLALRRLRRIARQRGLTLVELMVALIVGLMVIMAAMSVFSTTSRSAGTVDAVGQLRDDARFAADIIQRLAVQTGFEDIGFVTRTYQGTPQTYQSINGLVDPTLMMAPISGFSGKKPGNHTYNSSTKQLSFAAGEDAPGGSDTLILRYQPVNKGNENVGNTDGSMITCTGGRAVSAHSTDIRTDRTVSIFYVDDSDGEPTLYCRYADLENGSLDSLSEPQPLVKGIESFKVLYGVDNITPNTAADCGGGTGTCDTKTAKLVPTRFLTADKMTVTGGSGATAATETNWRRVRALRIGIVLRSGNLPIQRGQAASDSTIYPLGEGFGGEYVPNSGDGDARLRQEYTFTVNIRNCLNQGYQSAGDPGKNAASNIPPCDVIVPRT